MAAAWRIAYLRSGDRKWDIVSLASVEISLVFFFVAIVLGSIWARPVWNTWWTWDPRLTTATVVELVYAAYLLLRQGIDDPDKRARFGAVYTIVGFISVPITFMSIPCYAPSTGGGSSDPEAKAACLTPAMRTTFSST
jgi:heme exporter protein C